MNEKHIFIPELEGAKNLKYTIDEKDLHIDLKVLIKEFYAATFMEKSNSLILNFNNGQKFSITIKEI